MPKILKQSLAIIASLLIIISTTMTAYALVPPEGGEKHDWVTKQYGKWTKDNRDPKTGQLKPGVKVDAKDSKGIATTIVKNPNSKRIATRLAKGLNTASIVIALAEMGLEGVDWVLDPENNAVKYKAQGNECIFERKERVVRGPIEVVAPAVCRVFAETSPIDYKLRSYKLTAENEYDVKYDVRCNPYGSAYVRCDNAVDEQLIQLEEIAQENIKLAEAGNQTAQELLTETVQDMGEAGELDKELDESVETQTDTETDTETPTKKDTDTQTKPSELPAFCEWTGLCKTWKKTETNTEKTADNTEEIKENTKTIREKISELFDWLTEKSDDDTQIDIDDKQLPDVDTQINFGGECPSDIVFNFDIYGKSVEFKLMEYSKLCPILSNYIKPVLYTLGAFFAVTIVGGRNGSS